MGTDKIENTLQIKNKTTTFIKNKAFDIIAIGIVVAMSLLSLGFVELRQINKEEIVNILVECIPLYFAATLLSVNYYDKGVFTGKLGKSFIEAVKYYSEQVDNLTGEQMDSLHEFCIHYNEKVKRCIQESILKSVAISYTLYNDGDKPLKSLSKKELKCTYNKETVKAIEKCKKLKIKGINVNVLLGNLNTLDSTDLGLNERQLRTYRSLSYATKYILTVLLMSLIGIKDVMNWGWMGAALTLFKVCYVASGAYMKYFNGYEDVNTCIVNHLYRKTDVLKEFDYWYGNKTSQNNSIQ